MRRKWMWVGVALPVIVVAIGTNRTDETSNLMARYGGIETYYPSPHAGSSVSVTSFVSLPSSTLAQRAAVVADLERLGWHKREWKSFSLTTGGTSTASEMLVCKRNPVDNTLIIVSWHRPFPPSPSSPTGTIAISYSRPATLPQQALGVIKWILHVA